MKVVSLLLALILSGSGLRAAQTPGARVEGVEIRGNRRIPSDTIKYRIQTKAGDVLNMEVIRRDVVGDHRQVEEVAERYAVGRLQEGAAPLVAAQQAHDFELR